MRVGIKILGAIIATMALTGIADAKKTNSMQLSGVVHMRGNCRSLMAADMNITNLCDAQLFNTEFGGQATEFVFMLTDGSAIVFHGQGGQAHSDPNTAIQTLTSVARVANGKRDNVAANGICRFTNPFAGVATIDCEATSRMGRFVGSFITDGSRPQTKGH